MALYTIDYNYRNGTGKLVRGFVQHYYKSSTAAKKDAAAMNRLDPKAKAVVRDRRKKSN